VAIVAFDDRRAKALANQRGTLNLNVSSYRAAW